MKRVLMEAKLTVVFLPFAGFFKFMTVAVYMFIIAVWRLPVRKFWKSEMIL